MGKKLIWVAVIAIAITAVAIGIYKSMHHDELLELIPQDAAMVMQFNAKSLQEKADFEKVKQMHFFIKMHEEIKKHSAEDTMFINHLMNPKTAGIDDESNAYWYMMAENERPVMTMLVKLKSKDDFEKFILSAPKVADIKIEDKGKYKMTSFDSRTVLGWDDKKMIFITESHDAKSMLDSMMMKKQENPITKNKHFNDFTKTKQDFGMFFNYESLMKMSMRGEMAMMGSMFSDFYKSTFVSAITNFETNDILMTGKYSSDNADGKNMTSFFKSKGISDEMQKCMTNKNVYAMFSFGINMDHIFEIIDKQPLLVGVMIELYKSLGLKKDEFHNMLGGDVFISVNDFKTTTYQRERYDYFGDYKDEPKMTMVTDTIVMPMLSGCVSIKDKDAFHKLVAKAGIPKEGSNYWVIRQQMFTVFAVEANNCLTFTNDSAFAMNLSQGKNLVSPPEPVKTMMSENPGAFYMDLDATHYPAETMDRLRATMTDQYYFRFINFMKLFKDVQGKGNMDNYETRVNLVDGDKNSLYRIFEKVDELYLTFERDDAVRDSLRETRRAEMDSVAAADSTMAVEAMQKANKK